MTPHTELDRLFAQELRAIPKPDPLAPELCVMPMRHITQAEFREMYPPIDPVDADEAVHGVCVQGEEHDQ